MLSYMRDSVYVAKILVEYWIVIRMRIESWEIRIEPLINYMWFERVLSPEGIDWAVESIDLWLEMSCGILMWGRSSVVYVEVLWLCILLIEDIFTVLNALISQNNVFKSKGMIVIVLIY